MVEETTARYAMVESLRSLPGAFRVTPPTLPQMVVMRARIMRMRSVSTTPTPPVPEHDIAVEAYAVHDTDTTTTTTNNNVLLGNRDVEDLEQPPAVAQS